MYKMVIYTVKKNQYKIGVFKKINLFIIFVLSNLNLTQLLRPYYVDIIDNSELKNLGNYYHGQETQPSMYIL